MLLLNHCQILIVLKKGHPFTEQNMKLPVILESKEKLAFKLAQTIFQKYETKNKGNLIGVLRVNNLNSKNV